MLEKAIDHLIDDTLSFVSPRRPRWAPVNFHEVTEEALLLASPLIETHCVEVRRHLDSEFMVWGDEGMIRQVVLNIVLNAVLAMPQGGELSISIIEVDPDRVGLRISDTGGGIDPAHRSRLFDPFFTTRPEGTGLGLAIAHNIMSAHGGSIEVETELGKGSTFTLVFFKEKGAIRNHATAPTF